MKFKVKIIRFLEKSGPASIDQLSTSLNVSRQYIHRLINELEAESLVRKIGSAPHVFYSIIENDFKNEVSISYEKEKFLNEHFVQISALGEKLYGLEAMSYWTKNQNLLLEKTIDEYIETRKKYLSFYTDDHLISGLQKLQNTKGIGSIGVDELFYLDFYAIERFGKTKLGTLMHYAKQGQNKQLMDEIVREIKNRLQMLIKAKKIDALLYVPPTITRKVQIMKYLEMKLAIDLPTLQIKKIANKIVIPQKALSKLFERVANAKNTFIVPEQQKYTNLLIIDDAIGSGATINEIALKVKEKNISTHIIGLAITGSYKGFEVISEL